MKVLDWYSWITGVKPLPREDREKLVERILAALRNPSAGDFDRELLEHDEIPDDCMAARWLQNRRQVLGTGANYPANTASDKGDVAKRIQELETQNVSGGLIALNLREEGYSFHEVTKGLRKAGYKLAATVDGTVPVLAVSRGKPTLRFWMFLAKETADLTLEFVEWGIS